MVGAFSVVGRGSSVVDSSACPSLCLDALPSCNLVSGGLVLHRNANGKKHMQSSSSLKLSSSFLGSWPSAKSLSGTKCLKKKPKKRSFKRSFRIVNEVAGQYEDGFEDVKTPGDGKNFIRKLGKEKLELAERVMITRLHLYGKWIKKCDHAEIYKQISDENLELMRERLMETVVWPSDDTNTEMIS